VTHNSKRSNSSSSSSSSNSSSNSSSVSTCYMRGNNSDTQDVGPSRLPDTPAAFFWPLFFAMPPATLSPFPDILLILSLALQVP
jgi:hypothetical protein